MKNKAIWVSISLSLITAISQGQSTVESNVKTDATVDIESNYTLKQESDGGLTVIRRIDGMKYFSQKINWT